ncbi:MAG: LysR family transcriptional regulator [Wujia sp.]
MTLKQLSYFLKIAETGNLTKAAEALNVSQPPLSYQLKLLEDELGVQLFIRNSRNMVITPEGEYLRDKSMQILTLIDKTVNELKDFSNNTPTYINIGSVSSINHNLLPVIIRKYKEKYPNTIFNIYDGSSMRLLELLDNGIIDMAIVREPIDMKVYSNKRVVLPNMSKDEEDYFVASGLPEQFKDNSPEIKLKELISSPLIIHRRFEDIFMQRCMQINMSPNIISRNDNIFTSIEWINNGLGIAIMPISSTLLISNPDIIHKKIVEPAFSANAYLVWQKNAILHRSIIDFISLF